MKYCGRNDDILNGIVLRCASTLACPALSFTASPSRCGGVTVGMYIPADDTKKNCFAPAFTAKSATGPTVSISFPLLSTTTSNSGCPGSVARSFGFAHIVFTPADVSSPKYVNGGFCIFLSSAVPTTQSVTAWPCAASVLASQKPMFACPPPFVLTMRTFEGGAAAWTRTARARGAWAEEGGNGGDGREGVDERRPRRENGERRRIRRDRPTTRSARAIL